MLLHSTNTNIICTSTVHVCVMRAFIHTCSALVWAYPIALLPWQITAACSQEPHSLCSTSPWVQSSRLSSEPRQLSWVKPTGSFPSGQQPGAVSAPTNKQHERRLMPLAHLVHISQETSSFPTHHEESIPAVCKQQQYPSHPRDYHKWQPIFFPHKLLLFLCCLVLIH